MLCDDGRMVVEPLVSKRDKCRSLLTKSQSLHVVGPELSLANPKEEIYNSREGLSRNDSGKR